MLSFDRLEERLFRVLIGREMRLLEISTVSNVVHTKVFIVKTFSKDRENFTALPLLSPRSAMFPCN